MDGIVERFVETQSDCQTWISYLCAHLEITVAFVVGTSFVD